MYFINSMDLFSVANSQQMDQRQTTWNQRTWHRSSSQKTKISTM